MDDLLKSNNIGNDEHIYDFEIIQLLKKKFGLTHQRASDFLKAFKTPIYTDLPYIKTAEFVNLFATN